jgi:hypothetical protein
VKLVERTVYGRSEKWKRAPRIQTLQNHKSYKRQVVRIKAGQVGKRVEQAGL